MNHRPLVLDLFSGIGGFALGATWAGCEIAGFCEIDPFCQRVLAKNFAGVPIHDDVRTLTGELVNEWTKGRAIDILVGGFPCQPFSAAGKQLAEKDERHLWPEMLRIIREVQPRWIVGENVDGIVRLALDSICTDLESESYAVETLVLPACGVSVPHRRYRAWIIASLSDADSNLRRASGHDGYVASDRSGDAAGASMADADGWRCQRIEDVAARHDGDRQATGRQESTGRLAECGPARGERDRHPTSLRSMDFTSDGFSGWLPQPRSGRHTDQRWRDGDPLRAFDYPQWESGIARVQPRGDKASEKARMDQLKALGNAVVPQIPYVLISAIRDLESRDEEEFSV